MKTNVQFCQSDHRGVEIFLKELQIVFIFILPIFVILMSLSQDSQAQTSTQQVILKYTCPWGPTTDPMVRRKEWLKTFPEKTQGRLKIELYGVGELCQPRENFEAVRTGVADIAHIISSYTPGLFPRSQLLESPIFVLPLKDPNTFSYKVMGEIADKINPEFERNGVVPSGLYWLGGTVHIYSKKPLQKLEDFRGVKISCVSEVHSNALKRLGFSPQIIPGAETYLALQKGVVDAALQTHGGAKITRYEEVTKYVTLLNWPQLGFTYVFNPASFRKLPEDLRSFLVKEFKTWHEQVEIGQKWQFDNEDLKWLTDRGIKVITLSKEETERINKTLPTFDEWVAEQEKKGVKDARQLGQALLKAIEKYSKDWK